MKKNRRLFEDKWGRSLSFFGLESDVASIWASSSKDFCGLPFFFYSYELGRCVLLVVLFVGHLVLIFLSFNVIFINMLSFLIKKDKDIL